MGEQGRQEAKGEEKRRTVRQIEDQSEEWKRKDGRSEVSSNERARDARVRGWAKTGWQRVCQSSPTKQNHQAISTHSQYSNYQLQS